MAIPARSSFHFKRIREARRRLSDLALNQTMGSEYQPISRVERLLTAHPWLLETQAWKLLSIKYVLMGQELTIHNPDHLELIMQEWTDHLVEMDDVALRQMCTWIDRSRLEGEQDHL